MRPVKWTPYSRHQFKQDTVEEMGPIMSETKKRKVHPPEFKAKVGLEALRGVRTINEIGHLKMELDWLKKSPG